MKQNSNSKNRLSTICLRITLICSLISIAIGIFGGNVGFMQSLQIKTSFFDNQPAVKPDAVEK